MRVTGQSATLTAITSSVAVTLVSVMVPNAVDSRPVNDGMIEAGYVAALSAAGILGFVVSLLDRSPLPLFGAVLCGVLVVAAHNSISRNGLVREPS